MDLSQFGINADGSTSGLTVPGLGNIQTLLANIALISIIIGGLFFVLYLINIIQRMRANRSTIAMHKDIAAIRAILEKQANSPTPSVITEEQKPEPVPVQAPIRDESESSSATLEHTN